MRAAKWYIRLSDDVVVLDIPDLVTVNPGGVPLDLGHAINKDCADEVWFYALGCLRNCKNHPNFTLHALLSSVAEC